MLGQSLMDASPVHLSWPSTSLFKFPAASQPAVVPAPSSDFTYATPFEIPPKLYNNLLSVVYPAATAAIYAAVVSYMNSVNRRRNKQPWPISKTNAFLAAVVLHNIFLALYSAWTFKGMWQALKHSWPGWHGEKSVVDVVDAMCKIHGPRGLGNGVSFNATTNIWTSPNVAVHVTPQGTPDTTDLGRLWNEGLGFYGWIFYLSKFYEVLDTAIVLAKGRTSTTLQTFHHAGALLSLWAGIRYMSPPIWLFVFLNSAIHTVMYTYYALTSLAVPVPKWIKRVITTLQITQFLVGASYAFMHLFVHYSAPASVPASVASNVASAVSAAPSVASSVASSAATSVASAVSSIGIGNIFRKVALRAAGQEGLAENVPLNDEKPMLSGMASSIADKMRGIKEEITYTTEDQLVPCIDTSGQAFAIWLNLLYLAPLTYFFGRFFYQSYIKRTSPETAHPTHHRVLEKASRDAAKGVERELQEAPVPLPEQTEHVANMARDAAERVVTELGKEADGYEEEMPGTYDGQDAKQRGGKESGGPNKEDGKPEQEITVNGNVTKDKQNDPAQDEAPAADDEKASSADEAAGEDEKNEPDQDKHAPHHESTPNPLEEADVPKKEIEEPQKDILKAMDEVDVAKPDDDKDAKDEREVDGSPEQEGNVDAKPEEQPKEGQEAAKDHEDDEGDSDKENRPVDIDGADNGEQQDDEDTANGATVPAAEGIYQPTKKSDSIHEPTTTESDIDQSLVVVNGDPREDDGVNESDPAVDGSREIPLDR